MGNELAGKVAIVTGGASGLGRASVERFVAEGAEVVIADLDVETGQSLSAELGDATIFRRLDVSDPQQVAETVAFAVDWFGGLHVMFNNAGISGTHHPHLLDDDFAEFHQVLAVNLLGVMTGTREAARHMAKQGGGSIVNTTSIGGIEAGRGVLTYRASKAAVIQFSKSAAIDLGEHGVRVNCIAPGNIPTPLLATSHSGVSEAQRQLRVRAIRRLQDAGRPLDVDGTPDDVAWAALYFASERARYVTGTVLRVDGGSAAGNTLNPDELSLFADQPTS